MKKAKAIAVSGLLATALVGLRAVVLHPVALSDMLALPPTGAGVASVAAMTLALAVLVDVDR